jgi:hypothetical protein
MDLTLVHEDICVYLDYQVTQSLKRSGKNITFVNDSIDGIANLGSFHIKVTEGVVDSFNITLDDQLLFFNVPLIPNDIVELDLDRKIYKKNGSMIFTDTYLSLEDNSYKNLVVNFTGTGIAEVTYSYNYYEQREDELIFVDSLSYDRSIEYSQRTNVKNKKNFIGKGKDTYSFSVSLLWNEEQAELISDNFRLRFLDEEGNHLDTLAGCRITSERKGSSSNGGDFTYEISGSCEKIY